MRGRQRASSGATGITATETKRAEDQRRGRFSGSSLHYFTAIATTLGADTMGVWLGRR